MTNTVAVPYLQQLIEINNIALGLPTMLVMFFGCIAVGYFIKSLWFIPNKAIPATVITLGLIGNIVVSPRTPELILRAICYGMASGVGAWIVHYKYLSKLVDDKIFRSPGTAFITQTKTEETKVEITPPKKEP